MKFEEFREQCTNKYRKQLENEETWNLLNMRQKVFGKDYVPKSLLRHLYRLSCPNCGLKLGKTTIFYDSIYDYNIYKCGCGYEYAKKERSL